MGLFYICHVLKNGLLLCALFWILVFTILATDPVAEGLATTPSVSLQEAGEQLYLKHVRPLFEERCQMCHTGESGQGGFDLSTAEGLLRGGKRGQAVIPGNAGGSLLYKLVTHAQEPVMPQKAAKLSPEAIALIEFWINVGAPTGSAASVTSSTAPNPPVVALAENALSLDVGATDELGFHAVEDRHYVTDIHATVLRQLGLDPRKLEIPGQKRLEIDFGVPIEQILGLTPELREISNREYN